MAVCSAVVFDRELEPTRGIITPVPTPRARPAAKRILGPRVGILTGLVRSEIATKYVGCVRHYAQGQQQMLGHGETRGGRAIFGNFGSVAAGWQHSSTEYMSALRLCYSERAQQT